MGREGVFYEIGAESCVHRYFLKPDWRKHAKKFRNAVRLEDFPDIDSWKGYFVECDPRVVVECHDMTKGYNCEWVQIAIGGENRLQAFANRAYDSWRTTVSLASDEVAEWGPKRTFYKFFTYQITLDTLFDSIKAPPDFLSIDIESLEYETLLNYSWRWKPKVILLDYHNKHLDFYVRMLEYHSYEIVSLHWDSYWQNQHDLENTNSTPSGDDMHAYTLNRDDRPDRWELYKAAMQEMGFEEGEIHRQPAYLVEDYANREELCDRAAADFPEFFNAQRDRKWPAYGHIVTTWGWMHILRNVASMIDVDFVFMSPDDYALKRPKQQVIDLCYRLGDVKILQFAYHYCDFVHEHLRRHYQKSLPRRVQKLERPRNMSAVWKGTGMGAADICVMSPEGAQLVLDYMCESPYVNFEHILYALDHEKAPTGTYSVVENNMNEDGNVLMQKNAWIQHLIDKTDGKASDLDEYYLMDAADWHNKPKVREKDG